MLGKDDLSWHPDLPINLYTALPWYKFSHKRNFVQGDYTNSPFLDGLDGAFDAALIQDIHPESRDPYTMSDIVQDVHRVLRPGGIVIFSNDDCSQERGVNIHMLLANGIYQNHGLLLHFLNR